MDSKYITRCQNDTIIELDAENSERFEMLEDFILHSNSDKATYLRLTLNNGNKAIKAADYVGILRLADGSCIELLPKVAGIRRGAVAENREVLYRMLSAYYDIPYERRADDESSDSSDNTFLEFFISVFARECMKIIKSGLLSGYESIEENTSQVRGTILFAENNRRNLVHRERLYVRHDEFTPDRVENRLMKSAAFVMTKLSGNHQNIQNLKKIMAILDEVKLSDNYEADFAKCINARNTKKYNTVLNICRLFLRSKKNAEYSGKFVSYALLFPMEDLFRAYISRLVKTEMRGKTVRTKISGQYLCEEQQCFGVSPDIVVCDELNHVELVIVTHWKLVETLMDVDQNDIYALFAYGKRLGCAKTVLIFPENEDAAELPNSGEYTIECQGTTDVKIRFARLTD